MKQVKMTVNGKTASFNAEYAASVTREEFATQNAHVFDADSLNSVYDKCLSACPQMVDHVVTEHDLENNPDLKDQGVEVGETIQYNQPEELDAE